MLEITGALALALLAHGWALRALDLSIAETTTPPERNIALASQDLASLVQDWATPPQTAARPATMRAPTHGVAPEMPDVAASQPRVVRPLARLAAPEPPQPPQFDTAVSAPPQTETAPDSAPPPRSRPTRRIAEPTRPLQPVDVPQVIEIRPAPVAVQSQPEPGEILTIEEFFGERPGETLTDPSPAPRATANDVQPGLAAIFGDPTLSEPLPALPASTGALAPAPAPPTSAATPSASVPRIDLSGLQADYEARVRALIEREKTYPRPAQRRGLEGTVSVTFTLDSSGKVISAEVSAPSGARLLDRAALDLVTRRIAQFPEPPPELGAVLTYTVPITYVLG